MINENKWIDSLPKTPKEKSSSINDLDHQRWTNTIPKKNTFSSIKKYSLVFCLFVFGLVFVSMIKNETRILQREINNLKASIKVIKFNLFQATLDNEVIKSPENISNLAKKYLSDELLPYKRSQIGTLNNLEKNSSLKEVNTKKTKNISNKVKTKIKTNITQRKKDIAKINVLYSNPDTIPVEIKKQVSKEINEKKTEIKSMYETPKEIFTLNKIVNWSAVQVVKAILGMPIVPGR